MQPALSSPSVLPELKLTACSTDLLNAVLALDKQLHQKNLEDAKIQDHPPPYKEKSSSYTTIKRLPAAPKHTPRVKLGTTANSPIAEGWQDMSPGGYKLQYTGPTIPTVTYGDKRAAEPSNRSKIAIPFPSTPPRTPSPEHVPRRRAFPSAIHTPKPGIAEPTIDDQAETSPSTVLRPDEKSTYELESTDLHSSTIRLAEDAPGSVGNLLDTPDIPPHGSPSDTAEEKEERDEARHPTPSDHSPEDSPLPLPLLPTDYWEVWSSDRGLEDSDYFWLPWPGYGPWLGESGEYLERHNTLWAESYDTEYDLPIDVVQLPPPKVRLDRRKIWTFSVRLQTPYFFRPVLGVTLFSLSWRAHPEIFDHEVPSGQSPLPLNFELRYVLPSWIFGDAIVDILGCHRMNTAASFPRISYSREIDDPHLTIAIRKADVRWIQQQIDQKVLLPGDSVKGIGAPLEVSLPFMVIPSSCSFLEHAAVL